MHGSLHHDPPHTPRSVLVGHRLGWVVAGLAATMGVLAAVDGGSVLLLWDRPIQEWVVANRTPWLEVVFRGFSRMGSNVVVFGVFAVLVAVTARRCRTLAVSLAVAVLARPLFEFLVKEAVDRERPDLVRLIDGTGPSHPSGHVLAAVTLWGLLPPLVALVTDRRWLWWSAGTVAAILITGIAASRIYLGVHWLSDIVQGLLLGWLYLSLIERLFEHHHRQGRCSLRRHPGHRPGARC